MEKKINIAELLKGCPKGMELDCTIFDTKVIYQGLSEKISILPIVVQTEHGFEFELTQYGQTHNIVGSKCVIFPKGKTTWEGFVPPCQFNDGDVIYTYNFIAILSHIAESGAVWYHCYYCISTKNFNAKYNCGIGNINNDEFRFATKEEKEKLFQAIKDNGYKWNEETKTLEKVIKPKFKVGDRIRDCNGFMYTVSSIGTLGYILNDVHKVCVEFKEQDKYELFQNKFNINTLKPFQKVLVRDSDKKYWSINLFGFYNEITKQFHCMGNSNIGWNECIPYESNEHLLGKTDDCDEYFKTW